MSSNYLESDMIDYLKRWRALFANGDQIEARNFLHERIQTYKAEFHSIKLGINPERRDRFLIYAITFRGLLDYMDSLETFPDCDWCRKPKCVEKTWVQLCNSKDRMRFVRRFYKNETIDWVIESIDDLEQIIERKMGKRLYMSIDVEVEKELCNICGNDIRSCSHIVGNIYDGSICTKVPQNPKKGAVALVDKPADPRCCVWPWNTKDEGDTLVNTCTILTWFTVDDFMYE
jgi:hypothetical protein